MDIRFFSLARSYKGSGKASEDALGNLKLWKHQPTRYRLEALPAVLSESCEYDQLRRLAFDSGYVLQLAAVSPDCMKIYRGICQGFLFKKTTRTDVPARLKLIDICLAGLTAQSLGEEEQLFAYILQNTDEFSHERSCLLLLVYTQCLLKKKVPPSSLLPQLLRQLSSLGSATNEHPNTSSEDDNGHDYRFGLDLEDTKAVVKLCFPVVADNNPHASVILSRFLDPYELTLWCGEYVSESNRKSIIEVARHLPKYSLDRAYSEDRYPIIVINKMAKHVRLKKICDMLTKQDIDCLCREVARLAESPSMLEGDERHWWHVSKGRDAHEVVRDRLEALFAWVDDESFSEYLRLLMKRHFPYDQKDAFRHVVSLDIQLNSKSDLSLLITEAKKCGAWMDLSLTQRIYAVVVGKLEIDKTVEFRDLQRYDQRLAASRWWVTLGIFIGCRAVHFLLSALDRPKSRGTYSFEKHGWIDSFKKLAETFLAGDESTIRRFLAERSTPTKSRRSTSSLGGKEMKPSQLKKMIRRLCRTRRGQLSRMTFDLTYLYDRDLPYTINFPRRPLLVSKKYYLAGRKWFVKTMKKSGFSLIALRLARDLHWYEFFSWKHVKIRYGLRREFVDLSVDYYGGTLNLMLKYWRALALQRACLHLAERWRRKFDSHYVNPAEEALERLEVGASYYRSRY